MSDESNDVLSDDMFYVFNSPTEGVWVLNDCGTESARKDTLPEMRAFVHGLWRGMSIGGEVDLTCAIYDANGVILDTMVSADTLK